MIHLILKVRKGENDPDQGIEIIQETLRIIDLQTTVMVATMTETNVLTITRVDFTTLEADGSLESMIGMTVFLAKIVTEDQVKSSKTVDSETKEATTHLE
jgi:DNA-binding transcriptional regulator YhcF (GntR family)